MMYYIFHDSGFLMGTFATFADAYEEMERLGDTAELFITTNPNGSIYWTK